jgi:hypothetical protein
MTLFNFARSNETLIVLNAGEPAAGGLQINPRFDVDSASDIANSTGEYVVENIEISGEVTPERFDRPFGDGTFADDGTRSGVTASITVRVFAIPGFSVTEMVNQLLYQVARYLRPSYTGTLLDALNSNYYVKFGHASGKVAFLLNPRLLSDPAVSMDRTTYLVQFVIGSDFPYLTTPPAGVFESDPLTAGGSGFSIPLTIPFTLTGSSGGTLEVVNPSSSAFVDSHSVVRMYGPITNPKITSYQYEFGTLTIDPSKTRQLVFAGSIASGDYWTVDLWSKRVFRNDNESDIITALDVAQSEWFTIPYITLLQLSGSGYTAQTKLTTVTPGAMT